jgi:omega-6 fatty acid desaturase (delta-12 desaturase)
MVFYNITTSKMEITVNLFSSTSDQFSVSLHGMKKTNIQAIKLLILPCLLFSFMYSTLAETGLIYLVGQTIGGVFFAQCFILLHEFGHRSMFKNSKLNSFFGYFFSFFVFIPYYNWQEIHDLHHKWTGFRDKDPTTEKTFSDRLSPAQEFIINFAWKFYVPIFTLGYRLGIYWKLDKLKRHLSPQSYKVCTREMGIYLLLYVALIITFPGFILSILPALYLSFIFCGILSLSQHSHIKMNHSEGKDIKPLKFKEQVEFSRSLKFNPYFSKYVLLNFNLHEAHHAYPGLPCYYLNEINIEEKNSYNFIPWLRKVKSMQGTDFIFNSSEARDGF